MKSIFPKGFPVRFALIVFTSVWVLWMIVVTISAFSLPKTYISTARLKLEFSGTNSDGNLIQNEAGIILDSRILLDVATQLKLNEEWGRQYLNGERMKSSEVLEILRSRLTVDGVKNSPVVQIKSFSDSAGEAAQIANALAAAVQASVFESQTNKSSEGHFPLVSVQIVDEAVADFRPYKPNIPLCILCGILVAAIYGAIAAVLAVGGRLLIGKSRIDNVDGRISPSLPIEKKY